MQQHAHIHGWKYPLFACFCEWTKVRTHYIITYALYQHLHATSSFPPLSPLTTFLNPWLQLTLAISTRSTCSMTGWQLQSSWLQQFARMFVKLMNHLVLHIVFWAWSFIHLACLAYIREWMVRLNTFLTSIYNTQGGWKDRFYKPHLHALFLLLGEAQKLVHYTLQEANILSDNFCPTIHFQFQR